MKNLFHFIMGLCMLMSEVNAQTTFNKLYPAIGATTILDITNNNYCVPLAFSKNTLPYRIMGFSKISDNGNVISTDTMQFRYNSTGEGASSSYFTKQVFDNNKVIAITVGYSCADCVEGCIIKFNQNMTDTLWTKTYKFQALNAQLGGINEATTSHNLYIHGLSKTNNLYPSFFSCFDANGNLLWEKPYDRIPNITEYIEHIEVVGNYLVLGGQQWMPNVSNSTDGFIAVYDLNGNYLYRQNYYGAYSDVVTGLLKLNNHEILAVVAEGTSFSTNGVDSSRILLQRIDLNTNMVVQSKYIGAEGRITYGKKPVFLDANKIIFAGNRWDVNRVKVPSIYAISTNLDSLWHHEYPNEIDPQNYIFWSQDAQINTIFVHNNSIFTAGEFFTNNTPTAFPPGSPNQYAWVMKLDTLGCLTPGCWTSVKDDDPNIWIADNPLGLYPNPANTQVTLRLPDAPQPYQIDVFDAHGKLMFDESRYGF